MIKSLLGLLVGLLIGVACRRFDIPLPGPTKIIGGLVILAITAGYMGMDFMLTKQLQPRRHRVGTETVQPHYGESAQLSDPTE